MNPTVLTPAAKKANYFEQQTKHDQTIFTPMDVQFEVEVLTSPDGQAKPAFLDWHTHSRQAANDNTESEYELTGNCVPVKKRKKKRKKKNAGPKKVANEVKNYEHVHVHETGTPEREVDPSAVNGRSSKTCNGLILDEAEDEDDVYEDDDETEKCENYADQDSIINDVDEPGLTARDIERNRVGKQITSEEIDEYLRECWNEQNECSESDNDAMDVSQELLLPTINDPNIWIVKCRFGEERSTVLLLMRKFLTLLNNRPENSLRIKTVFVPEGAKGYILVEGYRQNHVKEAISDVSNLRVGQWKQEVVPITQMTDLLKVNKQIVVKPKQLVRLRRGKYKDDIAQVESVYVKEGEVLLKLLPRIDNNGALRTRDAETDGAQRKLEARPQPKLFDLETARAMDDVTFDGNYFIFKKCRYSQNGFLLQRFKMSSIVVEGVQPTLAEQDRFGEQLKETNIELAFGAYDDSTNTHSLSTGDNVEVCGGDLRNLQATIIAINGNLITVQPKHKDLKDSIVVKANDLRKHFETNDHVNVIAGRYTGESGFVVLTEERKITILSDKRLKHIEVLPRHIVLNMDRLANSINSTGRLQSGDFVQLDKSVVGVIDRLTGEHAYVLDMYGKIIECNSTALQIKKSNGLAVALDSECKQIRLGDTVTILNGKNHGQIAIIKHLYRGYAFLHNENCGIFVTNTKHLSFKSGTNEKNVCTKDIQNKYKRGMQIKITKGCYKSEIGNIKDIRDEFVLVVLYSSGLEVRVAHGSIDLAKLPLKSHKHAEGHFDIFYNDEDTLDSGWGSGTETISLPSDETRIPRPIFVVKHQERVLKFGQAQRNSESAQLESVLGTTATIDKPKVNAFEEVQPISVSTESHTEEERPSKSSLTERESKSPALKTILEPSNKPTALVSISIGDSELIGKCGWLTKQDGDQASIYLPFENQTVILDKTQFQIIQYL